MFPNKLDKYQKNYDYLVNLLKESNLDTREKVEEQLEKVFKKVLWFSTIVILLVALLCGFFPEYYPIWGILGLLALAWGWYSALNAVKIMRQYMKEELSENKHQADS